MKIRSIAVGTAMLLALAGCSSDSDSAEPAADSTPSATTSAPTPSESEDCLDETDDWLRIYDALDESTTLEDPSKETTEKVVDDSEELVRRMKSDCSIDLANAAVEAHNKMLDVDSTLVACGFDEMMMCGNEVDDRLDKALRAVETVRSLRDGSDGVG